MYSSLLSGLVAYWPLSESSGSRWSFNGLNTLTDNNTVTGCTGVVGQSSQFVAANSEYLSASDNADLSTGDIDFTFCIWINGDSFRATNNIIAKSDSATVREHALQYNASQLRFLVFNAAGGAAGSAIASVASLTTGLWYFVAAWHDSINNTINIQVNNLTQTASEISTTVDVPSDTVATLNIGAANTPPLNFWDGRLDAVGFWKRVLSPTERAMLYNNGLGLAYPFDNPTFGVRDRRPRSTGQITNMIQP